MGVDIHGLHPQIVGEQPERPDWETATEYERDLYFDRMDLFHSSNPGVYFRSSWWGWRPIHLIADAAIKLANLPYSTEDWGSNDGGGLKTQQECDALADAIELYLELHNYEMHDLDDTMYVCLGCWNTTGGKFLSKEQEAQLNEQHPIGTILYRGVVCADGTLAFPSHSSPLYHIHNFISFLRKCGGFEIF